MDTSWYTNDFAGLGVALKKTTSSTTVISNHSLHPDYPTGAISNQTSNGKTTPNGSPNGSPSRNGSQGGSPSQPALSLPVRGILSSRQAHKLGSSPKQLSFDVPASPALSAKSSLVSHSASSSFMFDQRNHRQSLRRKSSHRSPPREYCNHYGVIRDSREYVYDPYGRDCAGSVLGCRDPSRFRLATLNQRSNSEACFPTKNLLSAQMASPQRRSSMAILPSREAALMRRILGPQGLGWIAGEQSSKKSISLVLSNDVEAQKGDDSETPLMREHESKQGGRLLHREQYYEKRRQTCDRALAFAIGGIVLMILESELRANDVIKKSSSPSIALKLLILLSTFALLTQVFFFYYIKIKLFMIANAAEDWRIALTPKRIFIISAEVLACSLCPVPIEVWQREFKSSWATLEVALSLGMFFRLYWLCRVMLLHSRLFTDASSRSIAGLNRVNTNARFILKTLMTLCPGTVLIAFTGALWITAGWILRFCERNEIDFENAGEALDGDSNRNGRPVQYLNSLWMIAVTFLSVGYGDIVPHTYCGKTMAVITGILGTCTSSMVVAVIARKLELTRAEKHVHNFMMETQLTKRLKHSAANVLRETWLIYKYRRLVEKPDSARIRLHQRKFLVAIYDLRKVKRDQRKLQENFVSLGDVARTTSNTYELVQDSHSTQEGLCLRITAIEHQLSDISRELSGLADLLRTRRRSYASGDETPNEPVRRRHFE
ncbi:unnamed protein product, partial [Mesorhabditis belari]|uniref:Calmodulin-binding domain-containing protein n=1 Tax=Mesorhabditis belari TaxID=2138241 RepID=A0AAF3F2L6_9BILA